MSILVGVAHPCNPNTLAAMAGGGAWIQDQLGLCRPIVDMIYWDLVSKKESFLNVSGRVGSGDSTAVALENSVELVLLLSCGFLEQSSDGQARTARAFTIWVILLAHNFFFFLFFCCAGNRIQGFDHVQHVPLAPAILQSLGIGIYLFPWDWVTLGLGFPPAFAFPSGKIILVAPPHLPLKLWISSRITTFWLIYSNRIVVSMLFLKVVYVV